MKQLKLLSSTIFFLGVGFLLHAQTNMNVHPKSGSAVPYDIATIQKLTFSLGNINVVPKTGTTTSYVLTNLSKLTFGGIVNPPPATCLNTNPDFTTNMSGWTSWYNTGTTGTASVSGGELSVTGIAGSTQPWHAQIVQNYNFKQGKKYTISFDARSTSAKNVGILIRECVQGDCNTADSYTTKAIGTTMQNYSITYDQTQPDYVYGQLIFEIGENTSDIYFDNICISEAITLDVDQKEFSKSLSLYPNPVKSVFNINVAESGNLDIISLDGKVLLSTKVKGAETNAINIENLSSGIYLCRYSNNKEVKTLKLIKQ